MPQPAAAPVLSVEGLVPLNIKHTGTLGRKELVVLVLLLRVMDTIHLTKQSFPEARQFSEVVLSTAGNETLLAGFFQHSHSISVQKQ